MKKRNTKWFGRDTLLKAVVVVLLLGALGWLVWTLSKPLPNSNVNYLSSYGYYKARVTKILYDDAEADDESAEGRRVGRQQLEVQFTNGPHKGETAVVDNYLTALGNVDAKVGMTIVLRYTDYGNGNTSVLMYNYDRTGVLLGISLIFMALLLGIGRKKGLLSLLGLIFTLVCLWFVLIPLMMRGYNMLLVTVAIVSIVATVSLLLLNGFNGKALSAILSCVMGVTVAGLCTWLVGVITPLNGLNMEEAERLIFNATDHGMKISGLLVCGVLLASVGAIMDVAMSIASAVYEMRDVNPELAVKQLFASGMNIGRDTMGTMSNTLIMALIGSSLNTFILTHAYEIPFSQLLNTDFIVIELVQGIAGAIGIVLTVPFVAFISAELAIRKKKPGAKPAPAKKGR